MTFNSVEALKNYILTHSQVAVDIAKEKIALIINHFLTEYYKEFEPEVYVRTYQLLNSLVKTDVKLVGNEWVAEVYFDLDALDYSTRIVPHGQPWSGYAKPENTYHREDWEDKNTKWVLETAMTGGNTGNPHGGYASGTAIWTESMRVLSKEGIKILKQELIKAGIPVK